MLALLIVLVAIQFIQPAHNKSEQVLATDFSKVFVVPDSIQIILQNTCYDCHSNNTSYPWYSNIQPMAWVMKRHIDNGKKKLNFNEFGNSSTRKQISRLKEIFNQIKDNEMPISSYKMMHKNARLSGQEKQLLISWLQATADSLSTNN